MEVIGYQEWVVDECPDANGFWTIRVADGTPNGDTEQEPIATVQKRYNANRIVRVHNLAVLKGT